MPWVDYEQLPAELQRAGCALGIFGTSDKAQRVIPNKAFQALACGTPLVTADTPAARELLVDGESALLVPPGDAGALADGAAQAAVDAELARALSEGGRAAYAAQASEQVLGARWRALLERRSRGHEATHSRRVLLWAAIAAYAAGFSALSILRHRAFSTGRFDLGNMVQAVWSTAHGHPLQITSLRGDQISRLGAHFDPVLAVFAPLWLVWPSPSCCSSARRSPWRSARCRSTGSRASTRLRASGARVRARVPALPAHRSG